MKRRKKQTKREKHQQEQALPTTIAEVEAAMEAATQQLAHEPPAQILEGQPGEPRKVSMSPSMVRLMKLQKQLFKLVFGREAGPHDPVFWDRSREHEGVFPMKDDPEHMRQSMLAAGVSPAMAYAAARTGRALTDSNQHLFSDADRAEWLAAVVEYEQGHAVDLSPKEEPSDPLWLDRLTTLVAEEITVDGPVPLSWHAVDEADENGEEEPLTVVTFQPPVLLPEGGEEGDLVFPICTADLLAIQNVLDEPDYIECSAKNATIGGSFEGHAVTLVLVWEPHEDADPIGTLHKDGSVSFFDDDPEVPYDPPEEMSEELPN